MNDPAYRNGVTPDSIIEMMQSVTNVLKGKSSYILVPVPIDNIAPATHISFRTKKTFHPKPLVPQSGASRSRRSYAYSLSSGSTTMQPIVNSQNQDSVASTDTESIQDEIMSTIEDFASMSVVDSDHESTVTESLPLEATESTSRTNVDIIQGVQENVPIRDDANTDQNRVSGPRRRGRRVGA